MSLPRGRMVLFRMHDVHRSSIKSRAAIKNNHSITSFVKFSN